MNLTRKKIQHYLYRLFKNMLNERIKCKFNVSNTLVSIHKHTATQVEQPNKMKCMTFFLLSKYVRLLSIELVCSCGGIVNIPEYKCLHFLVLSELIIQ